MNASSFASPGIALIRRFSLRPLKRDAQRCAQMAERETGAAAGGSHVRHHIEQPGSSTTRQPWI
jgi:hypothetical protein